MNNTVATREFTEQVHPTFNNIIVELDALPETTASGRVAIPNVVPTGPMGYNRMQQKVLTGTIKAAGPSAGEDLQPGTRVLLSEANYIRLDGVPGFPPKNKFVIAMTSAVLCTVDFTEITISYGD